jgi:tetratricopeptide (TPR) repeat protein
MKYITTIFYLFLAMQPVFGLPQNNDSLKLVLSQYESTCEQPCAADSAKVKLFLSLGFGFEATEYEIAFGYYSRAQELAKKIENVRLESAAWSYMGIVRWRQGQYDQAISYHLKALDLREALGLPNLQANSLNNIGLVYFSLGSFDKAAKVYRRALQIYQSIPDSAGQSSSYTNLGLVHRSKKEYDSAVFYYHKSLEIDSLHRDFGGVAICYNNMGNVAKDKGMMNGLVNRRFRSSVHFLSSVWLSCWVNAGQPSADILLANRHAMDSIGPSDSATIDKLKIRKILGREEPSH